MLRAAVMLSIIDSAKPRFRKGVQPLSEAVQPGGCFRVLWWNRVAAAALGSMLI